MASEEYHLQSHQGYLSGHFHAMASPCELLMETDDSKLAMHLTRIAWKETRRIEQKFSRYRPDNIVYKINQANGEAVKLDKETADLIDYAEICYLISEGLFDITSGVLREVWQFDGSDRIPLEQDVSRVQQRVGWQHVQWNPPVLQLQPGMQIDLGGIGKEYAVDRVAMLLREQTGISILINFGGDLYVTGPRQDGHGWHVAIEKTQAPAKPFTQQAAASMIELKQGALATSGDARRFLISNGKRYSHILNPKTGWPVANAPSSITVTANTCTEAGILSTLAMLHGEQAEQFLQEQGVRFWAQR